MSKATVSLVQTTREALQEQCVDLRIVYNPEFLTEKNHIDGFPVQPSMHIFGGINADTDQLWRNCTRNIPCTL